MAYIETGVNQPGIIGLLFYKGSTGKALSNLAQTLLNGPSSLGTDERELIASYVSKLNECKFCYGSHSECASAHYGESVHYILNDIISAPISGKLRALLMLAAKVQISGKAVEQHDIDLAKQEGATDEDIHDTVLIAASFCMFNRYVDGLGTDPGDSNDYPEIGKRLAKKGYKYPPKMFRKWVIKLLNKTS